MESDAVREGLGEVCLEVKNLWKVFGPDAGTLLKSELRSASKDEIQEKLGVVLGLRDISLQVRRGEFFVIMGLSGSGKSTLIRCLLRLIEPTAGAVVIAGEDICCFDQERLRDLRRNTTGMVFQHFGLLPHYTVLENAAYGLKIRGVPKEERHAKAREALETVGLSGWGDYHPGALSGGMQQRVGLARALANEPEILLMDEPFSGLDPLIRRQIQDELVEIQDKVQKTIIFVTHDLYEALKLGDRIVIMRDGEIIQVGTPEEIISTPADDYVREFVQDASPARVLTAGSILEEPQILLYEWQGPKAAQTFFRSVDQDYAFVVDKKHRLVGLVTQAEVAAAARDRVESIRGIMATEVITCSPDTVVEELFGLATSSPYAIAVVDENRKFLGKIRNWTILDSMVPESWREEAEAE